MKEILLGHAAVWYGKIGKAVGIVNIQHLFDPSVDRKGLPTVETEQQRAFRHLGADSADGLEGFSRLVDGHGGDGGQVDFPAGDLLGGVQYVFCLLYTSRCV